MVRIRASLLCMLVVLALALGLIACRELTAPVQPSEPASVLAQGRFVRSDGTPLTNADVIIQPQASELRNTFRASIPTDSQGHFETWVPNIPMQVELRPENSTQLPNMYESDVQFRSGETRTFVLKGDFFSGVLPSERFADLLSGSDITMRAYVRNAAGELVQDSNTANLGDDGRFEIFLPQEGRYFVRLSRCCETEVYFTWPDSIEVVRGDTIRLDVRLVSFQLELRAGGQALPPGHEFYCRTDYWQEDNHVLRRYDADGSQLSFDMVGLAGATKLELSSYAGGRSEDPVFVHLTRPVSPLVDGDHMSLELGQYLLQVHVIDTDGNSLQGAYVYLDGEDSYGGSVGVSTPSDGRAYFRFNPGGFHLHLSHSGFYPLHRYFPLNRDSQLEIEMQPVPNED